MKKYPIKSAVPTTLKSFGKKKYHRKTIRPKKSIVHVYFPHRDMGWSYYNDSFDLKVGDFVYVEGKLAGYRGRVTEVNYSFKIKVTDYKKVIALVDTTVIGDIYFAGSHFIAFDKNVIPFSKVLPWFKAPQAHGGYVYGYDDSDKFPLSDLSKMKIPHYVADRGYEYYAENKVSYIEINRTRGRAIVSGSENYEIEFNFADGEISNLRCSCFCSGACKHEFAVMLQLKETLELIDENYNDKCGNYFAIISKSVFANTVMSKKVSGKISLGV